MPRTNNWISWSSVSEKKIPQSSNGIRNLIKIYKGSMVSLFRLFYDIFYDPSRWNGLSGGKRKMWNFFYGTNGSR